MLRVVTHVCKDMLYVTQYALCYTYAIGLTDSMFCSGVDFACCIVPQKRETPAQQCVQSADLPSPRWETS